MPQYLLKVADKESGTEVRKEFEGADRSSAQDSAIDNGWVLAEPKARPLPSDLPKPSMEPRAFWTTRFWNAEDPAERAIVRGVCKAYCIILWYTFIWVLSLAIAVGIVVAGISLAQP